MAMASPHGPGEANAQLYTEVTALKETYNYLGDDGIGVIRGNDGVCLTR